MKLENIEQIVLFAGQPAVPPDFIVSLVSKQLVFLPPLPASGCCPKFGPDQKGERRPWGSVRVAIEVEIVSIAIGLQSRNCSTGCHIA